MLRVLIFLVSLGARAIRAMCRCRADLVIENLALRQQVTVLKKERPRPPVHHQYPSAPEIKDLRTVHASANERISRLRSQS